MTAYGIEIPAPGGIGSSPEQITEAYVGQYLHLLLGSEAYLLKVTEAHLMPGGQLVMGCEREVPAEEPVPEPEFTMAEDRGVEIPDGECLRMALDTPRTECPAAGSPRCHTCIWRPAEEAPGG